MGNEIAIVKPAVDQENRLDNLILAIRAKDIDLAKDQLAYLAEQIGRKTPVRFRNIDYNGHTIGYLSLKGFFSICFWGNGSVSSTSPTIPLSAIMWYSVIRRLPWLL